MSIRDIQTVQVVYKKSTYEIYIQKHRDPRMAALIEKNDPSIQWMLASHQENQTALAHVRAVLKERKIRARWSYRAKPGPLEGVDLVLAVGGDGTLLEAARMISDDTPLLGMRSTPSQSVGFLCAGDASQCEEILDSYIKGELPLLEVSRIEGTHNGEPILPLALNDVLFSHVSPAATSRYSISLGADGAHFEDLVGPEVHHSSGLWVATATGSTAAIHSAGGQTMSLGEEQVQFVTRELYKSTGNEKNELERGFFSSGEVLEVRSHMRRAFLFFDGPWVKRPVYYGDALRFKRASHTLKLAAPIRYK